METLLPDLTSLAADLEGAEARLRESRAEVQRSLARFGAAEDELAAARRARPPGPFAVSPGPGPLESAMAALDAATAGLVREAEARTALTARLDFLRLRIDPSLRVRVERVGRAIEIYRRAWEAAPADPVASALADEWDALEEAEARRPAPPSDEQVAAAEAELAVALARLERTEDEVDRPAIRAAIEAARSEVAAAEMATAGRFGGRSTKHRLRDANARLAAALADAGYESYLDYMVADHIEAPRADLIAQARVVLEAAEDRLAGLLAERERAAFHDAEPARQTVRERAADLLGFVPSDSQTLRDSRSVDPAMSAALARDLGIELAGDQPLIVSAEAWLQAQRTVVAAADEAVALIAKLEAELAARSADSYWEGLIEVAGVLVRHATERCEAGEIVAAAVADAGSRADDLEQWQRYEDALVASRAAARAALEDAMAAQRAADAEVQRIEDAIDPILGPDWTPRDLALALARRS